MKKLQSINPQMNDDNIKDLLCFLIYTVFVFICSAIFGAACAWCVHKRVLANVGIERIEQRKTYVDGKLVSVKRKIVWLSKGKNTAPPMTYGDTVWTNGDFSVDFVGRSE